MFTDGRLVEAAETALFVSDAGNRNGEPLVLLHGGLGSGHDFAPLASHLAAQYRLVAIDSRGHGRSPRGSAPLSYQQLERDIAAVLNVLGLADAGIIGHSDGGIVGLRLAAGGRVAPRFVVAVGAHWQLPSDDPARAIYSDVCADDWRGMFADQVQRYEAENPAPDFDQLFTMTRAMWLGQGPDAYPGPSVRSIACPLLVVHGDDDVLVSRRQAFELAEQVAGARLLNLPYASHTVLEDQPETVLADLRAFIAAC